MTNPHPSSSATEPSGQVNVRRLDRFLPKRLRRAGVGQYYGPGGMAAAPDSPASRDAESRALEADSAAKHRSPPPTENP